MPLRSLARAMRRRLVRTYLGLYGVEQMGVTLTSSFPHCVKHPRAIIRLGSHCKILNTLRENPAGISHRSVLAATEPGARLIIGHHVGMSGVVLFASNEIVIEDYVNLGVGVQIFDTDFHPLLAADRRVNSDREVRSSPVRICEDAFLGANVIVLKGVTIGARAVIGAGAVVSANIPSDCVAGGVPARVLARLEQ